MTHGWTGRPLWDVPPGTRAGRPGWRCGTCRAARTAGCASAPGSSGGPPRRRLDRRWPHPGRSMRTGHHSPASGPWPPRSSACVSAVRKFRPTGAAQAARRRVAAPNSAYPDVCVTSSLIVAAPAGEPPSCGRYVATGASMRISPRLTASAMTRPVIALVIDPTSIGVVSSAPIPASRTGWAESRSTSATAMSWWPASVPLSACTSMSARTVASPLRVSARFGDKAQDTSATVSRTDEHRGDEATRGEVGPGQDEEQEQRLPAVVGIPAVPATAQGRDHHGGR